MAILHQFPNFGSLSAKKFIFSSPISLPNSYVDVSHKCRYGTVLASSKKNSSRGRGGRKVKSNADLCNDIREFLSTVGLPENYVPTMKELSQHGRQDLAHIVRRRGYKLIKELLENSYTKNLLGCGIESDQNSQVDVLGGYEGRDEQFNILADDVASNDAMQKQEENFNSIETDEELRIREPASFASQSNTLSLHEKAARFVRHGELDVDEDGTIGVMNVINADETGWKYISEDSSEPESAHNNEMQQDLAQSSSSGAETLNGTYSLSSQNAGDSAVENSISSNNYILTEEPTRDDKESDGERNENQTEVQRLKLLLHQKEMELIHLKEQIEKEKLALSNLQTKAETEISKAQKLISEKDVELRAAEETLSGLVEVEIRYTGDADTVEIAGSFNGWHHKIKMDPQPLMDPTESRTPRAWQAVLWLYPGVYEVKFVVDGRWITDPQRESITRDGVHNNVLRVLR